MIYAQDQRWAEQWGDAPEIPGLQIIIGQKIAAGDLELEWWDADQGKIIKTAMITHPGGQLVLSGPKCIGHIAVKLKRIE